jgi:photosystem II stability/assembly factor-like uncharacterized protein
MKNKQEFFCTLSSTIIFLLIFFFRPVIYSQWINICSISTTGLNSVKFLDAYTGITMGNNGIWRTTDSGFNWAHVLNSSKLNSIAFYNLNEGMAVGHSGKIYRTTDNGVTWQQLNSGTILNLNSIAVVTICPTTRSRRTNN